jgi:hypothetical protein
MKLGLHFYTLSLSLTLNNTSPSLDGGSLGILNPKLPRTGCKFSKRIAQFSKIKNYNNRFAQAVLVHVRTKGRFSIQFSQSTMSTGSHCENQVKNWVRIREPPNTGVF